ncbi:hypothetical protein BJX99DRAFT_258840 [Aspergillus californicus]
MATAPDHVIDPHGDVTLIVRNYNAPFAIWGDDEPPTPSETGSDEPIEMSSRVLDEPEPDPDPEPEKDIRILVSAKHLTHSSPVFDRILNGYWNQGPELRDRGSVEIVVDGWDVDALLVVLNIMHADLLKVPRRLELEQVAKIAVIADHYGFQGISFVGNVWLDSLEDDTEVSYSRDAILWLWLSYSFRRQERFKIYSVTCITQSNGPISSLGLPIPGKIVETMNEHRVTVIENMLDHIYATRNLLLGEGAGRGCSFECSSIMLGALLKHMRSLDLPVSTPPAPYKGVVYTRLRELENYHSPVWGEEGVISTSYFDASQNPVRPALFQPHSCYSSTFKDLFGELGIDVGGLHLEDYIR